MCTCVGMRFSLGNRSHNENQNFAIIYVYDIVNTCMYVCTYMHGIQWHPHQLEYSITSDEE